MAKNVTAAKGPHSRNLRPGSIDNRTRPARFMRDIRRELVEVLGGNVTVQQRLLIDRVAEKALCCAMLGERLVTDPEATVTDDKMLIYYSNSLRRDLGVLGLEARAAAQPNLRELLSGDAA